MRLPRLKTVALFCLTLLAVVAVGAVVVAAVRLTLSWCVGRLLAFCLALMLLTA
ncbi:hypothetical protein [Bifidobacterium coryneforme]|uniref:Uncharacterized protein n=1 Tax=Bifidobacterium [indicum] DSM 20214 = LMG 11587 TaxID=1341694 RepID=A0A087VV68_9BIFI|nr:MULTISPECIES: hypothetical protein [Bifidobacterium]AIC92173.1 hypothetical protein BINDI_0908 [Bifidobacterium indicum LMG 11587 = DSM 20214]AII74978.1 hypothetical protein BCOR_0968 [Bifidobacterium coryneforme]